MKTDKLRQSNNIEDRCGQGHVGSSDTPFGRQSSSMGSNLLLSLLFSRMGWKGKLLLFSFFSSLVAVVLEISSVIAQVILPTSPLKCPPTAPI